MYTQDELKGMIFWDLETAPGEESLGALNEKNPKLAELWTKRCEYLRKQYPDKVDMTDEELYIDMAALQAEFNRIVCASFGRLSFDEEGSPSMIIKSYSEYDEYEILQKSMKVFNKFEKYKFVGHSIKMFDVPVICKRLLINGFQLPPVLRVHDKKPWEMPFIDTSDVWSFGSWKNSFASLELFCTVMGLETPKDDIRGEEVGRVFWEERDLDRISTYCNKDVLALAQVLLKLSGMEVVQDYET